MANSKSLRGTEKTQLSEALWYQLPKDKLSGDGDGRRNQTPGGRRMTSADWVSTPSGCWVFVRITRSNRVLTAVNMHPPSPVPPGLRASDLVATCQVWLFHLN